MYLIHKGNIPYLNPRTIQSREERADVGNVRVSRVLKVRNQGSGVNTMPILLRWVSRKAQEPLGERRKETRRDQEQRGNFGCDVVSGILRDQFNFEMRD